MNHDISIGGGVSGGFVVGDNNSITAVPPPAPTPAPAAPPAGKRPRFGFAVDIVGFGKRDAEEKADIADRLDTLTRRVLADVGVDPAGTDTSDAGDSRVVFLPVGTDTSRVIPALLTALTARLAGDNRRFRDRMRLRMAVATGLLGHGRLGLDGELIIDLNRLLDSDVLRRAIIDHPDSDLVLLVGHAVHDDLIRPRYLAPEDFTPVEVEVKEYRAHAWLRVF